MTDKRCYIDASDITAEQIARLPASVDVIWMDQGGTHHMVQKGQAIEPGQYAICIPTGPASLSPEAGEKLRRELDELLRATPR